MPVRVVVPPDPIVTPADIAGAHASDDADITSMIAAVTEEIDGPGGWLGRALGPQTLLLTAPHLCHGFTLPYRPIIAIDSITYLDPDEEEQTIDDADFRLIGDSLVFGSDYSLPALFCAPDAVRIQYQAGYDGETTGTVPERARQAIIASVQHLKSMTAQNLFLRSDEVVGVGTKQYTVSDVAGRIIADTCERLLSTLRVYA